MLNQMAERNIPACLNELLWNNTSAISTRFREIGLQYAVQGDIFKVKICNKGGTRMAKAHQLRAEAEKALELFLICNNIVWGTSHFLTLPGKFAKSAID